MLKTIEKNILLIICSLIFLLSIFLRSTIDIGADTGFYIDLGKKIANHQKYYYDFFESNFPISFYIYALQYNLSTISGINIILMSDIFINSLGLASILYSAKILKRADFADKNHYNLIIITFFITYFLRIEALQNGEFGTKTSFFLILIYPYFAYSLLTKSQLNKIDLICRGCLMGLMPCFKPHYIILPFIIELYKFWQQKKWYFFIELDKLIAMLIMALYLNFLVRITPEFLEFMVPMWKEFYGHYKNFRYFLSSIATNSLDNIIDILLIIPAFLYLKINKNDKILIGFVAALSLLIILESAGTIDQEVVFYSMSTLYIARFCLEFFQSNYFDFYQNKFLVLTFLFIPAFDIGNFFNAIINITNIWWILVPIIFLYLNKFHKNFITTFDNNYHKYLILYVVFLVISILSIFYLKQYLSSFINCILFLILLFLFEKVHKKFYNKASFILIFVMLFASSHYLYKYFYSIWQTAAKDSFFASPNPLSDDMALHIKKYAQQPQDDFLSISSWIAHQYPLTNYLEKNNNFKYAVVAIYDAAKYTIFNAENFNRNFVFTYLFDDFKKQLKNDNLKIVFVNISENRRRSPTKCNIGTLEYYYNDPAFKKIFLENFYFKNRILHYDKKDKILYDFEVYIRK